MVEDAVAGMVLLKGYDGTRRPNSRLEAMPHDVVEKVGDNKWRSVKFENRFLRAIGVIISLPCHMARIMDARLDNQCFIARVAKIMKKGTKKILYVELKREEQCRKFM